MNEMTQNHQELMGFMNPGLTGWKFWKWVVEASKIGVIWCEPLGFGRNNNPEASQNDSEQGDQGLAEICKHRPEYSRKASWVPQKFQNTSRWISHRQHPD